MARLLRSGLAVAACLAAAGLARAQTLSPYPGAIAYDAGSSAEALVVRDMDGVGRLDMVAANREAGTVSVLLADDAGGFEAPVTYPAGELPTWIATGDFNTDGLLDLVVANQGASGVSVLLGTGGGALGPPKSFPAGGAPCSVDVGDFNGDTRLDLAVANTQSNNVSILFGHGGGNFVPGPTLTVGSGPSSVVVADVNGDGQPDLATLNELSSSVSIHLGLGGGAFGPTLDSLAPDIGTMLAAGDLDGDGDVDLAASYGSISSGGVSWLPGLGAGTFGAEIVLDAEGEGHGVALADLDGNGDLDVASSAWAILDGTVVTILLGEGGGAFASASKYPAGDNPLAIGIADLTGDDVLDVAVTSAADSDYANAFVLAGVGGGLFTAVTNYELGDSGHVAVADFTADGHLDVVVLDAGEDRVTLLTGKAGGKLVHPTEHPVGDLPFWLAVGDLDGDELLDVVTGNDGDQTVSVLLGASPGPFAEAQDSPVGGNLRSIALGDMDEDGQLDLVAAFSPPAFMSVFPGLGDGSFGSAISQTLGDNPGNIEPSDLDDDGHLDVAVTHAHSDSVGALFGQGGGVLGLETSIAVPGGSTDVVARDFDEDGLIDLAVMGDGVPQELLSLLPGVGGGQFGAATTHPAGTGGSLAVGDATGDGWLDIGVANFGAGTICLLLSEGDGAFGEPLVLGAGNRPGDLAFGDLGGDGRLELVVTLDESAPKSVIVLDNQTPEPAPWTNKEFGLLGAAGVPHLAGTGTLAAGSSGSLTLQNARTSAAAILFVSLSSTPVPFKGGGLVPVPVAFLFGAVTDSEGVIALPWIWPSGVPSATELYFQFAIQDPAAIKGVSLSNALLAITP